MNPKPAKAGLATTAGILFTIVFISNVFRMIVNLVRTIIDTISGYGGMMVGGFQITTFLFLAGCILAAIALFAKKKNHLFTVAFAVLTFVAILQVILYGFSILSLLEILAAGYATAIAACAVNNPPIGFVKYTWFVPVVFQLVFCVWFAVVQIQYMSMFMGYGGGSFLYMLQFLDMILREILLVAAFLLTMLWLATPQPQPWGLPAQPWQPQPQPMQPQQWQPVQGQPWQGVPQQQGQPQPWQTQPQPWQQPTQPAQPQPFRPWEAPNNNNQ